MQGKRLLAAFLPLLLIGVFLFLLAKDGFFGDVGVFGAEATTAQSEEAKSSVAEPEEESEGGAGSSDAAADGVALTEAVDFGERPFETVGKTDSTTAAVLPEDNVALIEATKEESIAVMGSVPGGETGLVTEFADAYEVTLPEETASSPAVVTGFADTLPLVLPLASPIEVKEEELRAVWVASVYNLDLPSKADLSANELKKELDALVSDAFSQGFNTIFFQVRPASDALYESAIFPASRFWTSDNAASSALDPLAYLIDAAHSRGLALHAWINPFRVTLSGESLFSLSPDNPARRDPSLTFTVSGQVYYDPALERVHELIADGVAELVARYDLDGVLFDDYFYPENITSEDSESYNAYLSGGGCLTLSDWRRDNISRLVERVYYSIKILSPDCLFGVAPRGIWRNSRDDPSGSDTLGGAAYDDIYCDALAWVRGGYIDYLSPQLYWSFSSSAAPFATLADWWHSALSGSGVRFLPSLAAYYLSYEEIARQKDYLAALPNYGGYAIYRYKSLTA